MTYDLTELCRLSGVTPRTVRYYIQQGLLPAPGSSGPGPHYGKSHLERLQLIRKLQADHLPLAEIRLRLENLDDAAVSREIGAPTSAGSAADYVRRVLGQASPSAERSTPAARSVERSTWERIRLDADVEIHVRRPLTRQQNRKIERLLEQARTIFGPP